jgi:RimJ/RimL family protein N-acetyltransferase
VLETARLRLRRYQASDLKPFVAMNADPEVMRFVGGPWSRERRWRWWS